MVKSILAMLFGIIISDFSILHKSWIPAHVPLLLEKFAQNSAFPPSAGHNNLFFFLFSTKHSNKSEQMWLDETIPQLRMREVVTNSFEYVCACVSVYNIAEQTSAAVGAAEQMTWKRLLSKL